MTAEHEIRTCPSCGTVVTTSESVLVLGSVALDVDARTARVAGEDVHLTLAQWNLLELFMRNPRRALSRAYLIERLHGVGYVGDGKVLDSQVKKLRQKIERDPHHPRHIVTLRGFGYRFDP